METRKISNENCKQLVFEFAEIYKEEFDRAVKDFPYENEHLPADLKLKNALDWFLYEWVNPKTCKTIVKEFTEKFSVPKPLKSKMLQMEKPFYSKFKVIENDQKNCLLLEDTKTTKRYNIVLVHDMETYKVGAELKGRIHQWGNAYRFAGIVSVILSKEEIEQEMFQKHGIISPDMMMLYLEKKQMQEIEGNYLNSHSKVSALLKNYPAHWIDGICDELKIKRDGILKRDKIKLIEYTLLVNAKDVLEELTENEKNCLNLVAGENGVVKYGKLKEFSDELSYWWNEKGVKSTVGSLRTKGLLYVGKTMLNERYFKAAIIPQKILPSIQTYLEK